MVIFRRIRDRTAYVVDSNYSRGVLASTATEEIQDVSPALQWYITAQRARDFILCSTGAEHMLHGRWCGSLALTVVFCLVIFTIFTGVMRSIW